MLRDRKRSIIFNSENIKKTRPKMSESIKEHIDDNVSYFAKILGSHVTNHNDITSQDMTLLKEAYDKSHATKNFEIELYWKRATYSWTLIAALITLCGLLINTYLNKSQGNEKIIFIILAISFAGLFITILCNLILQSGEYWKKNWEIHTVLLEPLFSGRLYATHVISANNRLSIAKLNGLLYMMVIACWLLIIEFIFSMQFGQTLKTFACSILIFSIFVFSYAVTLGKVTSSINKPIDVFISGYIVNSNATEGTIITNSKKNWKKQFIQAMVFLFINIILSYLFLYFVLGYK